MLDLRTLFYPKHAKRLPLHTAEHFLAERSIRFFWHLLYDPCPKLLECLANNANTVFEEFLDWTEGSKITFNWSIHLYFFNWLKNSNKINCHDDSIIKEVLIASAYKWHRFDLTQNKQIILGSSLLPLNFILGKRPLNLLDGFKVVLLTQKEIYQGTEMPGFIYKSTPDYSIDLRHNWEIPPL